MERHFHKFLFKDSALNEELLVLPCLWIDHVISEAAGAVPAIPANQPATGTGFCPIDWRRRLTAEEHNFMIRRILSEYERKGALCDELNEYKNHRQKPENLFTLRQLTLVWFQVKDFLQGHMEALDFAAVQDSM